jgi:hypothetical protein
MTDTAREDKIPSFEAIFEVVKELPFEQCRHNLHVNKESLAAGYPAAAVRG